MEQTREVEKQLYEVTMLTTAEDFSRAKENITKFGGNIEEEKPQGKVRLAYPLKKQSYAFLEFMKIKLGGDAVGPLSNELRLDQNVLRFLVSTPRTKGDMPVSSRKERPAFRRTGFSVKPKSATAETLTNEALEKKIEEISQ